jgi:hypothetical protein
VNLGFYKFKLRYKLPYNPKLPSIFRESWSGNAALAGAGEKDQEQVIETPRFPRLKSSKSSKSSKPPLAG